MSRRIDPSTIVVNEFVAHRVPRLKGEDDKRKIQFSAAVPTLPPATLAFFARRLKRAFSDAGQNVEVDETLAVPKMPDLVKTFLTAKSPDLLAISNEGAKLLQGVQTASPHEEESLVATMDITVEGQRGLAVAKLEQEQGVEFNEEQVDGGGTTLVVSVNERLLLTDNTRVFKAAGFRMEDGDLVGVCCDVQQGHPTDLAKYFLSTFLGCRHQSSPARMTKGFVAVVEAYASKNIADADVKMKLDMALKTEIASNRSKIDPRKFVQVNLPQKHQAPMLDAIKQAGVPTASFDKDLSSLGRTATRSKWTTASGISINGPLEAMQDRVSSSTDEDGNPIIVIRDTLKKVG